MLQKCSRLVFNSKTNTSTITKCRNLAYSSLFLEKQPNTNYSHPLNSYYPNPKGMYNMNPDVPLKDIIRVAPDFLKKNFKQMCKEIVEDHCSNDYTEIYEDFGSLRHDEVRVEFSFTNPECFSIWELGSDSVWNQGNSWCELVPTKNRTALFRGCIDTTPPKTGNVQRAGWTTIKANPMWAFDRKKMLRRWRNFTHIIVKCRGDGRSYKVNVHSPGLIDVTWLDLHSFPLFTHGGPYWQLAKIPLSKLAHNVGGRLQDRQYRVCELQASSVSIVLMDRIDGPFQLELDWIGVWNDTSHLEEFAYESYTAPVLSTLGI